MATEVGLKVTTFFSPDDDTQTEFINFVKATQKSLRIAIYGFHLPPVMPILIDLHKQGKDVRIVCDHTQAEGTYEKPDIQQLRDAGIPVWEGESTKHHIMHHKFAVRDENAVLAGSWNFSESASEESNYFDIVENAERAQLFLSKWQEIETFMQSKEAKWNKWEAKS